MSKLFEYPEFPAIISSDLADVKENIDNFLETNSHLELLIPAPCRYRGYRFITPADQEKVECRLITINKVELQFKFTRYVESSRDHFCPLRYRLSCIKVEIFYKKLYHEYKNDTQLKKFIKECKKATPK